MFDVLNHLTTVSLESLQYAKPVFLGPELPPEPYFHVNWEQWFWMDDDTYECVPCAISIDQCDAPSWATLPGLTGFTAG